MPHASAIIIGAGQCGLAMSRALTCREIDHIVVERGEIGSSWRTQRWDSLRMLTPNWANTLPGISQADPDGFMTPAMFVDQLESFARTSGTPVLSNTPVERIMRNGELFEVFCKGGRLTAPTVILATGAASRAVVPSIAKQLPKGIDQITPDLYRSPSDIANGGVLVVGASASGVQLARELRLAGHEVALATGNHVRLPRRYRGQDIERWLHVTGVLDQKTHDIFNLAQAIKLPSPQLMGGHDNVDLNALQAMDISIVGRLAAFREGKALFSGGLPHLTTGADLKMHRLFDLADSWAAEHDFDAPTPDRPDPTALPSTPTLSMDLTSRAVKTVVWATGFAPDFSMLDMPAFDARGRLKHEGGVCAVPGLFVLGLPFLRRRRSHHISGAWIDAYEVSAHVEHQLKGLRAA